MFEVTATGKNINYGKKGEKRELSDSNLISALKEGWIENKVKHIGNVKDISKVIPSNEKLMPIKYVDVNRTLEAIQNRMDRIENELQKGREVINNLIALVGKVNNDKPQ